MRRLSWISTAIVFMAGCGGGAAEDGRDAGVAPPDAAVGWQLAHLGPSTGFVSAVHFAPGGTVWISGDDTSGLYRSSDGGSSLARLSDAPLDWSTYGFATSADGQIVIAPSHFGRGVAVSTDAGASWEVRTAGLPQGPGDARRIHDALVLADGDVLLASGDGLYRGPTAGPFAPVVAAAFTADPNLTRLSRTSTGFVAGSHDGRLYVSADATAWSELTTQDGPGVTDLAVGSLGTYVATAAGLVVRLPPAGAAEVIADPGADVRFASALSTRIAVVSSGNTDRIYLGLVGFASNRADGKLLVSEDGGATFAVRATGLAGASIFDVDVDPADPDHVVVGTIGDGAFVSRDAGVTWAPTTGDLRAAPIVGFAQDPDDPEHLVVASSENLPGTPSLRVLVGGAWTRRDALLEDGRALAFDDGALLVGGFAAGPTMRRGTSAAGPFAPESGVTGDVWRIARTSRGIFAAADTLTRRVDGAWVTAHPAPTLDVVDAPEGVIRCGLGMHLSASGDFTDAVELSAPARFWSACARDEGGALFAAGDGQLWTAPDLASAATQAAWSQVPTPLDGVQLMSAVAAGGTWVLGGGELDVAADVTSTSRSGLYASEDRGATWVALDDELAPSRTVYRLHAGRDADEVFVAMWGGGLWALRR